VWMKASRLYSLAALDQSTLPVPDPAQIYKVVNRSEACFADSPHYESPRD
jgi:hypothetical protein